VTVFGIFFTPVFYVVIRWLTGQKGAAPKPKVGEIAPVTSVTADGPLVTAHGAAAGGQGEAPTAAE
jgi:hypothetical protein